METGHDDLAQELGKKERESPNLNDSSRGGPLRAQRTAILPEVLVRLPEQGVRRLEFIVGN
jgi:hypothetical protein